MSKKRITASNFDNEKLDLILKKLNKLDELEKINEKIEKLETLNGKIDKLETLNGKIDKLENKIITDSYLIKPENKIKYDVILKIVNKMLEADGKPVLKLLTEFQNIKRENILNINTEKIIDEHEDEIFKVGFTRAQLRWGLKPKIKNYMLTFLKYACENVGLDFRSKMCNKVEDGKYVRYMVYDIIKS